jgi:hypothetical protein
MALRYRMTSFAQPPEADNADSDREHHNEANERDANAHVPRDAGHHEVGNGEKDVRQHLGKAPLSLGPQPSASRAASANSQKPRRGLTISGPMSRGGGEAKSPNQGHAIVGQHSEVQVLYSMCMPAQSTPHADFFSVLR